MDELNVKVNQTAGKIECNFDEIRSALAVQMSAYLGQTVTEDEIPKFKEQLATLRKIRTAVDNRRKEIKNDFMTPLTEFENEVKKLLEEIDKPINEIDQQLKLFEEDRKIQKREYVKEIYDREIGEFSAYLPFETIFNPKWLNKSYSDNDIIFDLSEMRLKVKNDLTAIKSLNSEIEEDIISTYINSGNDLAKAIERNTQYLSDKAKVVEQVKEVPVEKPVEPVKEAVKVTTAKIVIAIEDLPQVVETLDFMGVKYEIEGV